MFRKINPRKISPLSIFIGSAFCIGLASGLGMSAVGPASAETDARTAYLDRAGALALDSRCAFLPGPTRAALEAATYQARGALLRSGASAASLATDARSMNKRAHQLDCKSKDVATIATRINSSFAAWTSMQAMDFPGSYRTWEARRNPYDGWLVSQALGDNLRFGVKRLSNESVSGALELPSTAATPAIARLVLRDPTLAREFVESSYNGYSKQGLSVRLPPSGATRSYYASGFVAPKKATRTKPASGRVFKFPNNAMAALADLDPREAASLVLEFDNPALNKTYLIEAGDLYAANAFLDYTAARKQR